MSCDTASKPPCQLRTGASLIPTDPSGGSGLLAALGGREGTGEGVVNQVVWSSQRSARRAKSAELRVGLGLESSGGSGRIYP